MGKMNSNHNQQRFPEQNYAFHHSVNNAIEKTKVEKGVLGWEVIRQVQKICERKVDLTIGYKAEQGEWHIRYWLIDMWMDVGYSPSFGNPHHSSFGIQRQWRTVSLYCGEIKVSVLSIILTQVSLTSLVSWLLGIICL